MCRSLPTLFVCFDVQAPFAQNVRSTSRQPLSFRMGSASSCSEAYSQVRSEAAGTSVTGRHVFAHFLTRLLVARHCRGERPASSLPNTAFPKRLGCQVFILRCKSVEQTSNAEQKYPSLLLLRLFLTQGIVSSCWATFGPCPPRPKILGHLSSPLRKNDCLHLRLIPESCWACISGCLNDPSRRFGLVRL